MPRHTIPKRPDQRETIPLGVAYPASPEHVETVMNMPADGSHDTRSGWMWFRLSNGDLILGVWPQGDGYFAVEVGVSDDYSAAEEAGTVNTITASEGDFE